MLSNSKCEKVRKLVNKGRKVLSSECVLNESIEASLHEGLNMKWIESKKDEKGNESKEEL